MHYRIGLDIGIASVGWSVIKHNEIGEPCRIVDLGTRIFNPAEKPKDGSSLAVDRRNARGLRRNIRRKKDRLFAIKSLLSNALLSGKCFEKIYETVEDVYELRYNAICKRVTDEQLSKVLLCLAKHRGFKSNRKSETAQKGENQKVLGGTKQNKELMSTFGYKTVGEMIFKNEKFFNVDGDKKIYNTRNSSSDYSKSFLREDIVNEIEYIIEQQILFGNHKLTADFQKRFFELFGRQRNFDEGPSAPSPFAGEFKVGNCTFIQTERRAPKASYTFEYFTFLTKLNNLKVVEDSMRPLSKNERNLIIEKYKSCATITFGQIRKILNLTDTDRFNLLNYNDYKIIKSENGDKIKKYKTYEEIEKTVFIKREFSSCISKIFNFDLNLDDKDKLIIDQLGLILSMSKSDEKRKQNFCSYNFTAEQVEELLSLNPTKFGNLSIMAMKNIIPFLELGLKYNEACERAGYNFNSKINDRSQTIKPSLLKDELELLTSPVVKRSISQTIKVVNAIILQYGSPDCIYIEMSREMRKTFEERNRIRKAQEERASDNEKYFIKLKELGVNFPKPIDIVKYRLYEEQGGKCAYSSQSFIKVLGSFSAIFENNATQIDHIIPFSKSFNDSYNNKVLVLASENQIKGNKLPYEAFGQNPEKWNEIESFANAQIKNLQKRKNLLLKSIKESEEELNNRALNDTSSICSFVLNLFNNYLCFAESKLKRKTYAVNGSMTAYLRKIWGIQKVRLDGDKHHAQDACVIACTSINAIKRVSKHLQLVNNLWYDKASKTYINKWTGQVFDDREQFNDLYGPNIKEPYAGFISELNMRLSSDVMLNKEKLRSLGYSEEELSDLKEVFISRMPTRKVRGQIHDETRRSGKFNKEISKMVVETKTSISSLKLDKENQIEGFPERLRSAPQGDPQVYNALKNRLVEFDGDAKKAFVEPIYKIGKGGKKTPILKVKLEKTLSNFIELENKTVVEPANMVRVDFFKKDKKNYAVPIYAMDVYSGILPNKAITPNKPKLEWTEMDENYEFQFSLYPNDLVEISSNKGFVGHFKNKENKSTPPTYKILRAYYISTGISTNSCSFISHDNSIEFINVGLRGISIRKLEVDVLGNISEVKHSPRQPITLSKGK